MRLCDAVLSGSDPRFFFRSCVLGLFCPILFVFWFVFPSFGFMGFNKRVFKCFSPFEQPNTALGSRFPGASFQRLVPCFRASKVSRTWELFPLAIPSFFPTEVKRYAACFRSQSFLVGPRVFGHRVLRPVFRNGPGPHGEFPQVGS